MPRNPCLSHRFHFPSSCFWVQIHLFHGAEKQLSCSPSEQLVSSQHHHQPSLMAFMGLSLNCCACLHRTPPSGSQETCRSSGVSVCTCASPALSPRWRRDRAEMIFPMFGCGKMRLSRHSLMGPRLCKPARNTGRMNIPTSFSPMATGISLQEKAKH